jgi:hypothetical protein
MDSQRRLYGGEMVLLGDPPRPGRNWRNGWVVKDLGGTLQIEEKGKTRTIPSTEATYIAYESVLDDVSHGGWGVNRQYRWDGKRWKRCERYIDRGWVWGALPPDDDDDEEDGQEGA